MIIASFLQFPLLLVRYNQPFYHLMVLERLVVTNQQQRELQKTCNDHQRVTDVTRQTKKHLEFYVHWKRRQPDARVELQPDLHYTLRPATLLRLEGINFHGNLSGRFLVE